MAKSAVKTKLQEELGSIFASTLEPELPVPASAWKRAFVLDLAQHGILAVAAKNVGTRTSNVRYERSVDSDFDTYVKEAIELANGLLEYNARLQALSGLAPGLMIKLLEANLPDKYSKQANPTDAVYVKAYIGFSPDEWDKPAIEGELVAENKPQIETVIDEQHPTDTNGSI